MQTSAIRFRVADFLKQHAPFQSMDEADLLALASRGRVKFHEVDEYICWQGAAHGSFVFVIQQGTVSLWEERGGQEHLRDIRGAGDIIGLDRVTGSDVHRYSAKTDSDVVLYALHAGDFAALLEKYPAAGRYAAASAFISGGFEAPADRPGAHQIRLAEAVRSHLPLTARPGDAIRDAARKLAVSDAPALAVVGPDGRVAGVATRTAVLRWIGDGRDPGDPIDRLMSRPPVSLAPDAVVSQCVLAIAESGAGFAIATEDGTPESPLHRIITSSDLTPVFGDQPLLLLREIARAPDMAALRALQSSVRAFVIAHLTSPASLDWLSRFTDRADRAILDRLIAWNPPPADAFCLCFAGAAGRQESIAPVAPRLAVITSDDAGGPAFQEWLARIAAGLADCGLLPRPAGDDVCDTLRGWSDRFLAWIEQPILNDLNGARPFFDIRPVAGDPALWSAIEVCALDAITREPNFVRILAHDCMANLPPLTFFRDQVVEESGAHSGVFELERRALRPLVDVGRVFGIASGRALGGSTIERLSLARTILPDHDAIFSEAAGTLQVVLYHQGRAGIRSKGNGFELPPSLLSRHDRQVLRTGFQSILRLLEFTSEWRWLDRR